jgi:hypothetical protein
LIPIVIAMLLVVACSMASVPASRIACGSCEEPDRFVRLQSSTKDRPEESNPPFSHPFQWSAEQWKPILYSIQIQIDSQGLPFFPTQKGPTQPAFTKAEVDYLSETLARAFTEVQPSEMVVFGLTRPKTPELTEITTGAWFVKGAQLHLLIGNYREAVTMSSTRQLLWESPLRPNAGRHHDFVAGRHQTVVRDTGVWSGLFSTAPSELTLAYQALLVEEPVGASSPQELSTPNSGVAHPSMSLENRLLVLKQLHGQGLITEEEYRAKKQQLLDQF